MGRRWNSSNRKRFAVMVILKWLIDIMNAHIAALKEPWIEDSRNVSVVILWLKIT